jgi:hypothetical protein
VSRLLAVVVVAACSGRAPAPTPVTHHELPPPDAGLTTSHGPLDAPVDNKPTAAECTSAIDHLVDLDVAERPFDQRPSAAELDKARAELRSQLVAGCQQELTRAEANCLVHAASTEMSKACTGKLFRSE